MRVRCVVGATVAVDCTAQSTDAACISCVEYQATLDVMCESPAAGQACPATGQATIDALYDACDGETFAGNNAPFASAKWSEIKPRFKALAETCGCAGAVKNSAPLLFISLVAVAKHALI
jgi:hypothetical protein